MIKLCIVEDLEEVRNTLIEQFSMETDLDCLGAYGSAEEALPNILLQKPDIVIMDIGLPEASGIECMVQIKYRYPAIRFLMFTIFDSNETIFESLKSGADGYILKRDTMEKIIASIREVMEGGAPMSRSIAKKVLTSFRVEQPKREPVESLTTRQVEILQLISKGLPYKLIGDQLYITEGTVKQHIHRIYKKLHVNNRTEATNRYFNRN